MTGPRLHAPLALAAGLCVSLPAAAARHVQVLRLQPGDPLTLFNGEGGEWDASVERMGRSEVTVRIEAHQPIEREASRAVHLAVGIPANERMDWLVEKAVELGAASLQPLQVARSVVRLSGERALKRQLHWQGIAAAACEQCGRNRVPPVHPVRELMDWLAELQPQGRRLLLSPQASAGMPAPAADGAATLVLSGPEGGLSPAEEEAARGHGFTPIQLGARILRAETAPLTALTLLTLTP